MPRTQGSTNAAIFFGKYIWFRLGVCQKVVLLRFPECGILFLRKGSLLSAASCVLKAAPYTHEVLGNYSQAFNKQIQPFIQFTYR